MARNSLARWEEINSRSPSRTGKSGDDISFSVHLDFGDGIDLKYTGKVAADRIDFKVQRSGADWAQAFVAKKST